MYAISQYYQNASVLGVKKKMFVKWLFHIILLNVTDNLNRAKSFLFTLCFTEKIKREQILSCICLFCIFQMSLCKFWSEPFTPSKVSNAVTHECCQVLRICHQRFLAQCLKPDDADIIYIQLNESTAVALY